MLRDAVLMPTGSMTECGRCGQGATAVHWKEQGNFSSVKCVGAGVYEYWIDSWSWLFY